MKKLFKWLHWVDDNLVHIFLILFIIFSSLFPKIPFKFVEYTYIRIRYDDIFPAIISGIFLLQFLRKKITLNKKFLLHIFLFWGAVFISFAAGTYIQNTIPIANIGLLHSLRRIQYMAIFFIAASVTTSKERFFKYINVYFIVLGIVTLYGLGQKFLQFPSIQSMNPAYVDGRLLTLSPFDRINSTFGGHFDLSAYLTFSIPLLLGFYFYSNKKRYIALFVLSLIILLYTAARSSFIAYLMSVSIFLLALRKFRFYALVIALTGILLFTTGDMTRRFQQTLQFKTVFVNEKTGTEKIDQKITTKELPAGEYKIPLTKKGSKKGPISASDQQKIQGVALEEAIKEAQRQGRQVNTADIQKRADELSKFIRPQRTLLCDISCATRLQLEWPRAVAAFLYSPLNHQGGYVLSLFFGTGPSSITEATDNDYLRWLGELGLVGTMLFVTLLVRITKTIRLSLEKEKNDLKFISYGFLFGLIALLINALYIDVFEASKVAYNFWLVAGIFVGFSTIKNYEKKHDRKSK